MFKSFIQRKLEKYVKKYFIKHPEVKLVAVTGSVGKTSTKMAIGTVLSEKFRVRLEEGNHNTNLSAPLAILGIDYPKDVRKVGEWLAVFAAAKKRIREKSDVDVIVQELGTDRIGQIARFGKYLHPNIGVVTAVSPEHMEYFGNIDSVAKEELELANFSDSIIINRDDIDGQFAKYLTNKNITTYGTNATAEYHFISQNFTTEKGYFGDLFVPEWQDALAVSINVFGEHTIRPAIAAAAVGVKLGMNSVEIEKGLSMIHPAAGRMNLLRGIENTIIIDDTYNSSPLAVEAALRSLYQLNVPQKIAVLGSMNELGSVSVVEHEKIGKMCNPSELAWVITVGEMAENFLAPAAKSRGCQVKSFKDSLRAGAFVRSVIENGAAVLFKGSEGGIFLEEAVKEVLQSQDDESRLVRQSGSWIEKKDKFFKSIGN